MSRPDESVTALPTGTGKLAFAEALRGLAAGLVVICHFAQVYWGDRQAVPSFSNSDILAETAYPTPWYIGWIVENPLIRNGACGVGLFFLLSGFVIQLSLKHYSMKGFVVGRVMRLYPTYIFGLSVTMMTVSVAGLIYNRPFPYLNTEVLLQYAVGLRSLIGSRSLDGISWTLEVEVHFYLLVAMSYATFKGGTPALVRLFVSIVLTALSAVVLAASLVSDVDAHFQLLRLLLLIVTDVKFFCFMSIGVVFALHHQGRSNLVQLTGRAGFLLAMCFLLWGCDNALENPGQPFTLMWSYLFALGIFSVCYGLRNKFSVSPALIQKLASVSFPLYIVHMSVGFFIMRLLHAHGYAPLPATGLAFCVVLALSYVIHVGVEVPFHRLGRRLARQLDEQPSQFVDRALKRADGLQGPL